MDNFKQMKICGSGAYVLQVYVMHIGLYNMRICTHDISVDRYLCVKTEHLLDGKVYLMLFAEVDKNNC